MRFTQIQLEEMFEIYCLIYNLNSKVLDHWLNQSTYEKTKEHLETCNIKYDFDFNNYEEMMLYIDELEDLFKDQIFEIVKKGFDQAWTPITDDNCEEITEQLNKEIAISIEADELAKEILNKIKGDAL